VAPSQLPVQLLHNVRVSQDLLLNCWCRFLLGSTLFVAWMGDQPGLSATADVVADLLEEAGHCEMLGLAAQLLML